MKMIITEVPHLFFGNYFCILRKRHSAFVCISKNACTFLKSVAIYNHTGLMPEEEIRIHDTVGYSPYNGYLIPVSSMQDYERLHGPLLKFAVWRDPVQRLLSAYAWFILGKNRNRYFQWLDLYADSGFDRFLEFVSFELGKSVPENQDEHIRRQCDYYEGKQVDVIVPLERLDTFLACNQLPVLRKQNQSSRRHLSLTDEQRETIRGLYARDYQFMEDNRHLAYEG